MVRAIIFCRECESIVAECQEQFVPNVFKCPVCGAEARVKWRKRKWEIKRNKDGQLANMTVFTAVCTQSNIAFRMKMTFPERINGGCPVFNR